MKNLLIFTLTLFLSYASYSQGCGPILGSSGGQQFQYCGTTPEYVLHVSNTTQCDMELWWNYFTTCTDHLTPSVDAFGPFQEVIPGGTTPANAITQHIYKIKSMLGEGGCNNTPCVDPCYMVVRDQNGNFVIPTNMDFTQIFGPCGFGAHPACPQPSGGTYCGWTDCYGMQVCVTIVHIAGNQYNINFHY